MGVCGRSGRRNSGGCVPGGWVGCCGPCCPCSGRYSASCGAALGLRSQPSPEPLTTGSGGPAAGARSEASGSGATTGGPSTSSLRR
ncbi:hypothetical protein PAMP_021614 [Pampus punctatissimus]